MKANSVVEATKISLDYLEPNGYFVSFQNGIVEDELIKITGQDKLISAIIGYGGTMHKPGVYEKTSDGTIHIGELNGMISRRLAELRDILSNVEDVIVTTNIRGALWSKLAINCAVNSLGALTGQTLGNLLTNKTAREIFIRTYSEVVEIAELDGIILEKIAANPYLLYRPLKTNLMNRFVKDLIIRFVGRKYRHTKSSTYQSLKRGRKSEVDFLNGYVVEKAKIHNYPVPMNEIMVDLIHKIENNELAISPQNINLIKLDKTLT
jgi:2-dehydropantoate 2-reductase